MYIETSNIFTFRPAFTETTIGNSGADVAVARSDIKKISHETQRFFCMFIEINNKLTF